jgi:wyosine [tRNA(Phe)-imidazoG37] synthetase (radical SAM superfamily)
MERGLEKAIAQARARGIPVKDISFSGNGEPTLSSDFAGALRLAAEIRDEAAARAELVVISNGTGLLRRDCYDLLRDAERPPVSLRLWLKLDAGGADWFKKINGCELEFERLTGAIKEFAMRNECVIQTMHCSVDGAPPSTEELLAWAALTAEIAGAGNVRLVQIYGKARPSPHDTVCAALTLDSLEERAGALEMAFETAGITNTPVEVYE